MEASGTPQPAAPPPPPPPPSGTATGDEGKASGGMRALAVLLALVLAFGAAVMIVVALNPDDTPRCEEAALALQAGECYDITETQQTIQNILAIPAGVLGALAALVALAFAATGRYGDLLRRLAIPAVALGIAAVIVGQL